jgi:hypothetical protein
MQHNKLFSCFLFLTVIFIGCKKETASTVDAPALNVESNNQKSITNTSTTSWTVFATGLNRPRGLKFGPDGDLYVAEAGSGGTNNSAALCPQIQSHRATYLGSPTGGRISRISSAGVRTTVTNNLPTTVSNLGDLLGVADVAFVGNTLYALLDGAGCSHGVPSIPNGIVKINSNGTISVLADLGSWQVTHPTAHVDDEDFEPEGTWFSMINVRNDLYALDPNHGELVKVTTDGTISRVADISATFGHIVPTAMDYHGNFYVGNLNTFPIVSGSSNIFKVTPSGQVKIAQTGFTTVLGVVFDNKDRMYVLENTVGSPTGFPSPGHGQIVRVDPSGNKETIATGLSLPTAITLGPDGNLYVSNWGFGPPLGQIIKVTISN